MNNTEIKKYLHSVPDYLLCKTFADLSDELQAKFMVLCTEKLDSRRIILLTGNESEQKEIFIVCLLSYFLKQNKKVLYTITPLIDLQDTFDPANVWVFAYAQADKTTMQKKIRNAFLSQIGMGRVLILGCDSVKSLEDVYGKSFISAVSHSAIEIDLSIEPGEIEIL